MESSTSLKNQLFLNSRFEQILGADELEVMVLSFTPADFFELGKAA